jgi:DNA ligase (NAD+)
LVEDYADLYTLTVDQVIRLDRMAQKSSENLIFGIEKSKEVPFERVLFALGIRYVGETVAKKLARHYKSIEALQNASVLDLMLVDEIGERIAQSVIEFFDNTNNQRILQRLKEYGIQFAVFEQFNPNATQKLLGKTFVVSGVFEKFNRDELKQSIEDNGGKVGSSISAKTDYVIAGANMGPAKFEKANQLGVPIISEDEYLTLLHEN